MATDAGQLITRALRDISVVAQGRDPSEFELDDGFSTLNDLMDALNREGLMIYERTRTPHNTVAGTASYTIGASGADITLARPDDIESAGVLINTGQQQLERPLTILRNAREWAALPMKNLQSNLIQVLYYDPSMSLGRIYYYRVPNNVQTVALYTTTRFSQFTDLNTSVTLPNGYLRMLRTNLAVELAGEYPGCSLSPILVQQAIDSKAALKSANQKLYVLKSPPEIAGSAAGYYDWRSDEVRS